MSRRVSTVSNISLASEVSTACTAASAPTDPFVNMTLTAGGIFTSHDRSIQRPRGFEENLHTAMMNERLSCLICSGRRKTCEGGLKECCDSCVKNGWLCFRGHESLWLWSTCSYEVPEDDSFRRHIRRNALEKAKLETLEKARTASDRFDVLCKQIETAKDEVCIHIRRETGGPEIDRTKPWLFQIQDLYQSSIFNHDGPLAKAKVESFEKVFLTDSLYAISNGLPLTSDDEDPRRASSDDLRTMIDAGRSLLQDAAVAANTMVKLRGLCFAHIYSRSGHAGLIRLMAVLLIGAVIRCLIKQTEKLVDGIVTALRSNKAQFAQATQVRYACGVYRRILDEIRQLPPSTNSPLGAVLQDLKAQASRATDKLAPLFVTIQRIVARGYGKRGPNTKIPDCLRERSLDSLRIHDLNKLTLETYLEAVIPGLPKYCPSIAIFPANNSQLSNDLFGRVPINMMNVLDGKMKTRSDILELINNARPPQSSASPPPVPASLIAIQNQNSASQTSTTSLDALGDDETTLVNSASDAATVLDAEHQCDEPKQVDSLKQLDNDRSGEKRHSRLTEEMRDWVGSFFGIPALSKRSRSSGSNSTSSSASSGKHCRVRRKIKKCCEKVCTHENHSRSSMAEKNFPIAAAAAFAAGRA